MYLLWININSFNMNCLSTPPTPHNDSTQPTSLPEYLLCTVFPRKKDSHITKDHIYQIWNVKLCNNVLSYLNIFYHSDNTYSGVVCTLAWIRIYRLITKVLLSLLWIWHACKTCSVLIFFFFSLFIPKHWDIHIIGYWITPHFQGIN